MSRLESRPRKQVTVQLNLKNMTSAGALETTKTFNPRLSTKSGASKQSRPSRVSFGKVEVIKRNCERSAYVASKSHADSQLAPRMHLTLSTSNFDGSTSLSTSKSSKTPSVKQAQPLSHAQTPAEAVKLFGRDLSQYERKEIMAYTEIHFLGLNADKICPDSKLENYGFDKKGVYHAVPHDHVAYRYEILRKIGQGTFSQVFLAYDHKDKHTVAIKIIKSRHQFYELSVREIEILQGIAKTYRTSSASVELLNQFNFRNHRILVFPHYHESLSQFLTAKHLSGLEFKEVLVITHQLALALSQIHRKGIIHSDLKPDNIMFATSQNDQVRLIDFGSACMEKHVSHQYVQSRYYRAPEVILGRQYTCAIDIWSLGCILVEMRIGGPLFRGRDSHTQLLCIMEYLGYPPFPVLQQSPRKHEYFKAFDQVVMKEDAAKPNSQSLDVLLKNDPPLFLDLVKRCLDWDPLARITAADILSHPLFGRASHCTLKVAAKRVAKRTKR